MARLLAVSLSGGGVRAMLFGLGALRAVAAAVESGDQLKTVASVSGGSIGTAYAFVRADLAAPDMTRARYDAEVLKPVFRELTTRSMMWRSRPLWALVLVECLLLGAVFGLLAPGSDAGGYAFTVGVGLVLAGLMRSYFKQRVEFYYGLLIALLAAAVVWATWVVDLSIYVRLAGAALALVLLLIGLGRRGDAIERGIEATLFSGAEGKGRLLTDLSTTASVALTATNLNLGEALYLTPRGIVSGRWGTANVGKMPLVQAARASANFPGVFPALHLPELSFDLGRSLAPGERAPVIPKRVALMDGGVYDNMGSEWLIRHTEPEEYILVVNASQNLGAAKGGFGAFLSGDLNVLKRDMDIQYDATTAPRRRWLVSMFKEAQRTGRMNEDARQGTIVQIESNLIHWLQGFTGHAPLDERGTRAQAMIDLASRGQADALAYWGGLASANATVGTSLDIVPVDTARRLIRMGYLMTAAQLHVLEGYAPPETLDMDLLMKDLLV